VKKAALDFAHFNNTLRNARGSHGAGKLEVDVAGLDPVSLSCHLSVMADLPCKRQKERGRRDKTLSNPLVLVVFHSPWPDTRNRDAASSKDVCHGPAVSYHSAPE